MRPTATNDALAIRRAVHDALADRGRVVLAVSGGVDSIVLLHAASVVVPRERLVVATFDHGTGPAASVAAAGVAAQAAVLGIPCVSGRTTHDLRGEAALREARWNFLRRVAADTGAEAVGTAHTRDDEIETVLMRVLRGASARGLAGLRAGPVVRPLLDITRAQVLAFARAAALSWIEDPSNASRVHLRNRVRHDLLPALRCVRPAIDAELLAIGGEAAQWRAAVESLVARAVRPRLVPGGGIDVSAAALAGYSIDERSMLWPAIAAAAGVTLDRRGVARLAAFTGYGQVGARVQLAGGWEVVRSRSSFELRPRRATETTLPRAPLSDGMAWGSWCFRRVDAPHEVGAAGEWSAWIAADRPAIVRAWAPGDTMRGPGGGKRKVKYFLSDAGVTGSARAAWPVVVSGDEIVWIPGVRRGRAASAVTDRPGLTFICEQISR
jgi:tRNA(Ile)-lysidine synthase